MANNDKPSYIPLVDWTAGNLAELGGSQSTSHIVTDQATQLGEEAGELINLSEFKRKIFREVPNNIEGINIQRVKDFLGEYGLSSTCDILIFDEKYTEDIKRLLAEVGVITPKNFKGGHSNELDLIFVIRNKSIENEYGDLYRYFLEGDLVHELAHDTRENLEIEHGHYIEEGISEFLRGEYNMRYLVPNRRLLRHLLNRMGARSLLHSIYDGNQFIIGEVIGKSVRMPIKYLSINHNGSIVFGSKSSAGLVLEAISRKIGNDGFPIKNRNNSQVLIHGANQALKGSFDFMQKHIGEKSGEPEFVGVSNAMIKAMGFPPIFKT